MVTLGATLASHPSDVQLELTDLVWRRLDRHQVPDYAKFAADRLNLPATDVLYDPAVEVGSTTVGRTNFTMNNTTGYTYYAARFLVVQFRGAVVGGINTVTLANLQPLEVRKAEVTWFEPLPAISSVKIVPDIDILDPAAYAAPL